MLSLSTSRSRKISGIALFAALAIVFNLTISFPFPLLPFLTLEVWEVPIMAAFLIFGAPSALAVAAINFIILQVIAPGSLPTGPLYNFIAIVAMMLGVYVAEKALVKMRKGMGPVVVGATALGAISRTTVMTVVNYTVLPLAYPIGFSTPLAAAIPLLLPIGIFNAVLALYTVPLAYILLEVVATRSRMRVAHGVPKQTAASPTTT